MKTQIQNNVKSQIQNKRNGRIGELLVTLNKIIRNEGSYFVVTMNNRLKIMCTWCSPLKYGRIFSKKKLLMRGQKVFWAKKVMKRLED